MALDLDQVFDHVGIFGCYQLTLSMLWFYLDSVHSYHVLVVTYSALEPPWRCVSGSTHCNLTGQIEPGDDDYGYRCDIPRADWEFLDDFTSIVSEWDLVCDKSLLGSVATSLIFPGWIVGMLIFGTASDRYGRKPVLYATIAYSAVISFLSSFSPTYWFFALFRFLLGIGVGGSVNAGYIMSVEFTGIKGRVFTAAIYQYGFIIGSALLAVIAYSFRDWRALSRAGPIAAIPLLVSWWFTTESPRWLLVEGKQKELRTVIYEISRSNGTKMPEEEFALPHEKPKDSKNGNTLDLFRNWHMTRVTLTMFFFWFSTALIGYSTLFASVTIGGNIYLNFGLLNLINVIMPPIRVAFMHKFGRKQAIMTGLLLASVSGLCALAVPTNDSTGAVAGRVTFYLFIHLSTSLCWGGVYLLTSEVFPTMTRNVGLAWCSTLARVGAFSAPYILWLRRISPAIPLSVIAGCALSAAICGCFIKDTLSEPTRETVAEIDIEGQLAEAEHKKKGRRDMNVEDKENEGISNPPYELEDTAM